MGHESTPPEEKKSEDIAEILSLIEGKGISLEGLTLKSISPPVTGVGVRLVTFADTEGVTRVFQVDPDAESVSEWETVDRP